MTGFTDNELARIREIAVVVAKAIVQEFKDSHIPACPWGEKIRRIYWMFAGIVACLVALGITNFPSLLKIFGLGVKGAMP